MELILGYNDPDHGNKPRYSEIENFDVIRANFSLEMGLELGAVLGFWATVAATTGARAGYPLICYIALLVSIQFCLTTQVTHLQKEAHSDLEEKCWATRQIRTAFDY